MKKSLQRLATFLVVTVAVVACASPVTTGEIQPSSPDQVATVLSMTLQALAPEVVDTPTSAPVRLLPHTFFYLRKDGGGHLQVFRIRDDGKTITQLTYEEADVTDYDVSLADGRVAYVANNQLLLVLPDGSNRRVLVDGGPRENNAWIIHPVFSPEGKTLAYGRNGLNLYDMATGTSRLAIEDQHGDPLPNGGLFPLEVYWPEQYSPDGTKLLVALGHWEVAPSHAIYYPDRNELVRPTGADLYGYCCSFYGGPAWSADSSSVYGIASEHDYAFPHGALWKVDAATGVVTTLISLVAKDGTLNFLYKPFPAPDGQLYYFFLNYPEPSGDFGRPPLQLVRAAADGVTNRTVLRSETFKDNEALWAPDASFVIMTSDEGQAEIVYFDGRPNVVLTPSAQSMKWGP
jgi:Periplasmic component of the Tol biopolymer transport system